MRLFHVLTEKPWITAQGTVIDLHDRRAFALPTVKLGLMVFLAVVTILFSLLVTAYAYRMASADWRSLPEPWLLWLNTAILITSSVSLQWARVSARRGQMDGVRTGLLYAGLLTFAFLAGQILVWQQLAAMGFYSPQNPALAFLYLLTGLHGVHLLGGLVAWGRTIAKVWPGPAVEQVRMSVELCAMYWHYLLLIWLVLFGLLVLT